MSKEQLGEWIEPGEYHYRYRIREVHKDTIRNGDVIIYKGEHHTVNAEFIDRTVFWGTTIFGDSYKYGLEPVLLVEIYNTRDYPPVTLT